MLIFYAETHVHLKTRRQYPIFNSRPFFLAEKPIGNLIYGNFIFIELFNEDI